MYNNFAILLSSSTIIDKLSSFCPVNDIRNWAFYGRDCQRGNMAESPSQATIAPASKPDTEPLLKQDGPPSASGTYTDIQNMKKKAGLPESNMERGFYKVSLQSVEYIQ